ncbi:hypothetical protein LINPERPRIM_LOCUS7502 [Linum perenne]
MLVVLLILGEAGFFVLTAERGVFLSCGPFGFLFRVVEEINTPRTSMTESSTSTIGSVCDNELEEIKCPICMEPPHNAILMHCSSAHLGCQPYMCNTSSRHSNCLDQFCSSSKSSPSSITLRSNDSNSCRKNRDGEAYDDELMFDNVVDNQNLKCPLCRGVVYGWRAIEPVRRYLNTKLRTCSSHDCTFIGNYSDLRKHARFEHPFERPRHVDLRRGRDWDRTVQAREVGDIVNRIEQEEEFGDVEIEIEVPRGDLGSVLMALTCRNRMHYNGDIDLDRNTNGSDDDHDMLVDNWEWPIATIQ